MLILAINLYIIFNQFIVGLKIMKYFVLVISCLSNVIYGLTKENVNFYNSFISVEINEIYFSRLERLIYNKFSSTTSSCANCSYTLDNK